MRTYLAGLVLLARLLPGAYPQETAWTYVPPAGHVDVSPAVGDVNGDGQPDIVIGSTAGFVVAVNVHGQELWRHSMGDAVCIPPTIADVTGDGFPKVIAVNRQGQVSCLDGRSGEDVWTITLANPPQWGATTLAAGDLRGDGTVEIVVGTGNGSIVCLAGVSGEEEWVCHGDFGVVKSPAIADLDGDGQAEVLAGTEKVSLLCLDAKGKELWRRNEGPGGSPFVYQARGENHPSILCGMGQRLFALDAKGATVWSHPMKRDLDSAIAAADTDNDGEPEIYAVDLAGHLVSLTWAGKLRWSAEVGQRCRRSPAIVDCDGDGKPEILVASYAAALHVFDPLGHLKTRVPLPGASNGTPTPVPLDGRLGIIVPAAGAPLQVLTWPGSHSDARILWGGCRCDARQTGTLLPPAKPERVQLTLDVETSPGGKVRATANVNNPDNRDLRVILEAASRNGKNWRTQVESSSGRIHRQLSRPMTGSETTSVTITCQVLDGKRTIARRRQVLHLKAFENELTEIDRTIRSAQALVPKLIDARGVEERAHLAAARLAAVRPLVSGSTPITETERVSFRKTFTRLAAEAKAVLKLATLGEQAAGTGSTLRTCAANPWAPFGGIDELAERPAPSPGLAVFAFGGETETAALNVFNLSGQQRTFRIEVAPLAQGEQAVLPRDAVALLEVLEVPTERCDMAADALSPLGTANVLHVPAWSGRQLCINVNTRLLTHGDWTSTVRLRSLDVEPVEAVAPLKVTVASGRLPEKQALHNCGWGYVSSSMLKDYPAEALADQAAHGTDVFVATVHPKAQFDAEGNLTGDIDFREHDAYVKQHGPHGILLFVGYQGSLHGPAPEGSDAYNKAHIRWLRAWVKHLAELGVGYERFALYPVDEPGLNLGLVETFLRFARLAREADARVQIYTDPVGGISEAELREMLPLVDIWCPHRGSLVLDEKNAAKLDIIKRSGKAVWMYECDDNAKHQSPLGYYRGQAWLAWRHGITGTGFWSYCTSQDDPWFVPKLRYDYLLVYPGNGVVSSKRWEAVRDGIEDYSMLAVLRQKLEARRTSAKPEIVAAADRLLGEDAARIGGYCRVEQGSTLGLPGATPGARTLADQRWNEIQRLRRELARLLESL